MDLELNGKVAIVGGASKGLGRACSEVLAEEGAAGGDVRAHGVRPGTGGGRNTGCYGDRDFHLCRRPRQGGDIAELVAGTVERFGQLDIMVNTPGAAASLRYGCHRRTVAGVGGTARCSSSRG